MEYRSNYFFIRYDMADGDEQRAEQANAGNAPTSQQVIDAIIDNVQHSNLREQMVGEANINSIAMQRAAAWIAEISVHTPPPLEPTNMLDIAYSL
jgi:hypothetical protein